MISELRDYWQAKPFVPFTIHLADRREIEVPHPEFFSMSPKGGHIVVYDKRDKMHVLNPLVIVCVSRGRAASAK
jgi:hypothetical protein